MRRYFLLIVAALGLASCSARSQAVEQEWALLYWLPYDHGGNSRVGGMVETLDDTMALIKGKLTSRAVTIAIGTDARQFSQHRRTLFTYSSGRPVETESWATTTDSADPEALRQFVRWARQNIRARRWAIVIAGHSGDVDQISPDEFPDQTRQGLKWMSIEEMAKAIQSGWGSERPDLLVLQTCNKSKAEALYAFRNAADLKIAYQGQIGGHDGSYTDFVAELSKAPNMDAAALGRRIVDTLGVSLFSTQVLVDNRLFVGFVETVSETSAHASPSAPSYADPMASHTRYADLKEVLRVDQVAQEPLSQAAQALDRAIVYRRQGTLVDGDYTPGVHGGVGVFVPQNADDYARFRDLSFYRQTRLWERVLIPNSPP